MCCAHKSAEKKNDVFFFKKSSKRNTSQMKQRSPPVGKTLGSGEPPEGRIRITKRPFKKKALDTAGAKHRPKSRQ